MPHVFGGHEVNRWSLEVAREKDLSDLAYRVFSAMLVKRDFKTDTVTITAGQLGEMVGKSKQTVWRALSMLQAAGLISETRKKQTGGHPINSYVLNLNMGTGHVTSGAVGSQNRDSLSPSSSTSTSSPASSSTHEGGKHETGARRRRTKPKKQRPVEARADESDNAPTASPDWARFGITPAVATARGLTPLDYKNWCFSDEEMEKNGE